MENHISPSMSSQLQLFPCTSLTCDIFYGLIYVLYFIIFKHGGNHFYFYWEARYMICTSVTAYQRLLASALIIILILKLQDKQCTIGFPLDFNRLLLWDPDGGVRKERSH